MSEVIKGVSKVWDRLFDQKGFLNGEIDFMLKEFEVKRGDIEVDNLFKAVENIIEIKDTQIGRLNEVAHERIIDANRELSEALQICSQFEHLEAKYSNNTTVEEARQRRKNDWDLIMNNITSEYSKINAEFEEKEKEMIQRYKDLEAKLK